MEQRQEKEAGWKSELAIFAATAAFIAGIALIGKLAFSPLAERFPNSPTYSQVEQPRHYQATTQPTSRPYQP